MTYEELRNQINSADEYSSRLGLVVTELDENGAKTELPILKEYHNPFRTVHGGILFTVADVTGGVAAYSNGSPVCTVDCDFHYLNAGLGAKRLYASAQNSKSGSVFSFMMYLYTMKKTCSSAKVLSPIPSSASQRIRLLQASLNRPMVKKLSVKGKILKTDPALAS